MLSSTFISAISVFLWAFILSTLCTPDVGIKKDWFSGGHDELVSFSGILTFDANKDGSNPVTALSNPQLVGLCAKAYEEMRSPNENEKPGAMALLAIDHEIYFASSIKNDRKNWLGRGSRIEDQRPQILARAFGAARISGASHRIGGYCAEINIMDLYQLYKNKLDFTAKRARIVIWGTYGDYTGILNPCGKKPLSDGYGCIDFLKAIANPKDPNAPLVDDNLKAITRDTTPRDNGWPDGVTFTFRSIRSTEDDKAACEMFVDEPFDPENPDQ